MILGLRETREAAHLEPFATFPSDYSDNPGETSDLVNWYRFFLILCPSGEVIISFILPLCVHHAISLLISFHLFIIHCS